VLLKANQWLFEVGCSHLRWWAAHHCCFDLLFNATFRRASYTKNVYSGDVGDFSNKHSKNIGQDAAIPFAHA